MAWCWSKVNGLGEKGRFVSPDLMGRPGFGVDWQFPMLIAAIDPAAEARLDGLNHALTSGRSFPETYPGLYGGVDYRPGGPFPVLATTDSGVGEYSVTQVQQLAAPAAPPVLNRATMSRDLARPGRTVLGTTITARQAYQYLLGRMRDKLGRLVNAVQASSYRRPGALPARPRRQPGPGHGAQLQLDLAAARHGHLLCAPGQPRHSVPDAARASARRRQSTLPVPIMTGTFSTAKIARPFRSAVPRPARAV